MPSVDNDWPRGGALFDITKSGILENHGEGKKLQNVHNLLSPVFQIMT